MKQVYIIHRQQPRLLLFFAGWGADETPFRSYVPEGSDFMLCYDYRTLDFDTTGLDSYQEICVVGWSMGVWAATQVMGKLALPVTRSIAINGTPYPINEQKGISPAIFRGTIEGLTGASLHKFLRRMCADSHAFREFLQVTPRRPLEELREELEVIERQETRDKGRRTRDGFRWQLAIVGSNDRIIPPANQLAAWKALDVPVRQTEDAHYQEALFFHYLQEAWTKE